MTEFDTRYGKIQRSRKLAVAKESDLRIFFRLAQQHPAFGGRESRLLAGNGLLRYTDNIIRKVGAGAATRIHRRPIERAIDCSSSYSNQPSRPVILLFLPDSFTAVIHISICLYDPQLAMTPAIPC
jgi:hypothetical protein